LQAVYANKHVSISAARNGLVKLITRFNDTLISVGQTRSSPVATNEQPVENDRLETAQAASMFDIGIRKVFNSDHDMFRSTARKFFKEQVVPYHAE
jgi:long-chain-acyl-CoA dehydrogenase